MIAEGVAAPFISSVEGTRPLLIETSCYCAKVFLSDRSVYLFALAGEAYLGRNTHIHDMLGIFPALSLLFPNCNPSI